MKTSLQKALFLPLLSVLFVLGAQTAQAEIYKWKDANGNMQYTQTPPPPTVKADNIEDDIKMSAGKASKTTSTSPLNAKHDEDNDIANARKKGEKNKEKHVAFCEQQESALKQLLANPVIRWKDENGERVLTAKERREKITNFENTVETMCNEDMLEKQKASMN